MTIPYGRQDITSADIDAVVEVLRSDYLTQGPSVPRFERVAAEKCGARHALAMNSATSALHVACLALGLGDGDWLWTSPITFVASSNCALYCGARVDFVDIDSRTYNISVPALEEKLQRAEKIGRLPKIVVPVHFAGQSCDMRAIQALGQKYGFHIIEDASHAVGGKYREEPVGSCRYSDVTIFSFHPVKIITTAEGGMALTNNDELAERMSRLRSQGLTREPGEMTKEPDGPWYYQQIDLGYNYRLTDVQAALGVSQMKRLDEYISQRHVLAERYDEILQSLQVITPWRHPDSYSAFHLYVVRINLLNVRKSRREVFESMRERGIGVQIHYIPVHTQPYYQRMGFKAGDFPEAERYYCEAITLPLFPKLSGAEQDQVVGALADSLLA